MAIFANKMDSSRFTSREKTQGYGNLDAIARMSSIDDCPAMLAELCEAKKITVEEYWMNTHPPLRWPTLAMVVDGPGAQFDKPVKTPEAKVIELMHSFDSFPEMNG